MKAVEIRNLSEAEIHNKLNDSKEELMKLRFQLATGELTDYTRLRFTRREIARYATILRELEQQREGGE
jgi:large subunit ribosomal protein L29